MPGFEWLDNKESKALMEVMNRGILFRYDMPGGRGQHVDEFEKAFARFCGSRFALAVSSGTAAVKVGLVGLSIGPGDEVIVPGFTFVATWEAIFDCGATPIFCEIDQTLCLDSADLEKKITPKTRCIVAVHMLGAQARINEIKAVADRHKIPVLEDTAQATGCTLGDKYVGTFGACGTFSFDAVKTLTTGEGGMVITDDESLYQTICEYSDHGHDHKPVGRGNEGRRFFGFNYRMMELQGALGLAQLAKLPKMLERMRSHKAALKEALARVPGLTFRELPDQAGDSATFLSWFMPQADQAKTMAGILAKNGTGAVSWGINTWHAYPHWEHLHDGSTPCKNGWPFKRPGGDLAYGPQDLPATSEILSRCLSWQIMLNWDEAELQKRTTVINHVVGAF
ncbi:8-amino-3,8-dideoxy-alpha-D-manno-octulosonate transaminase [Desulfarculales bacterium]